MLRSKRCLWISYAEDRPPLLILKSRVMPVHYQFLQTFRDLGRKHRRLGWFSAWRGFCCNVHPCRDLMNQLVPKAQLQNLLRGGWGRSDADLSKEFGLTSTYLGGAIDRAARSETSKTDWLGWFSVIWVLGVALLYGKMVIEQRGGRLRSLMHSLPSQAVPTVRVSR
jgi:hypothetical protein